MKGKKEERTNGLKLRGKDGITQNGRMEEQKEGRKEGSSLSTYHIPFFVVVVKDYATSANVCVRRVGGGAHGSLVNVGCRKETLRLD